MRLHLSICFHLWALSSLPPLVFLFISFESNARSIPGCPESPRKYALDIINSRKIHQPPNLDPSSCRCPIDQSVSHANNCQQLTRSVISNSIPGCPESPRKYALDVTNSRKETNPSFLCRLVVSGYVIHSLVGPLAGMSFFSQLVR